MHSTNLQLVAQPFDGNWKILYEDISHAEEIWNELRENGGMMSGGHRRGFRRVFLVVRMLKMLVLKPKDQDKYLRCLRTYFAVLPDPFVSSDEVREFLLRLLPSDSDRYVVDGMVDLYEEHFGRQLYGPRRLAHQATLVVRKSLLENKSATLPKLVEALELPSTLKDFLLGDPEKHSW